MELTVKIPYIAAYLRCPLPSKSEIEAAPVIVDRNGYKVVKVGADYVVKFGSDYHLSLTEGKNMLFVQRSTNIKIPKLCALYTEGGINYIVMEYVEGETLRERWQSLSDREKEDITSTLKQYFVELRNLHAPSYFGSLNKRPMPGIGMFWTAKPTPEINGPFENEADLNEAMVLKYFTESEYRSKHRADFYRRSFSTIFRNHQSKFTHGDLQQKNLIISRRHSNSSDNDVNNEKMYEVTLIDWETAGWYPSYWEYAVAAFTTGWEDDWSKWLVNVLEPFDIEFPWLRMIYFELWS